ncbi:MAG: gamma-glutamylcyclotransferase family protein [Wenzhouxiangella sp.]|jgi:hypothetical protein|nr:gamma-glutamylcyclotransferase family protein [Wenzhouxiangella sp.]
MPLRVYLAYGSNLHPRRLEARVGAVEFLGAVRLSGWSLQFDKRGGDGSAKANLRAAPDTGHVAYAAAYRLQRDQIRLLDVFEGWGHGYETLPIAVRLDGEEVQAFTYLAPTQWLSDDLLPFDWYADLIVAGARFHRFDTSYVRKIAAQPAKRDRDLHRARRELGEMNLALHRHYKR